MEAAHLTNLDEIRRLTEKAVEAERVEYAAEPEPESQGQANNGKSNKKRITSEDIIREFHRNEIGDAWLFINHHADKLVYDTQQGRWYIWVEHFWKPDELNDALYRVQKVVMYYEQEYQRQCWLELQEVKKEKK